MFGLKSTLINATLAASFAIPVATAGVFVSAGSAQAAVLTGTFQLSSGFTTAEISSNSIQFSGLNPFTVALPNGAQKTGSFTDFNIAKIDNILSFSPVSVNNPFLDLGKIGDANNTFNDGKNIFNVTSIGQLTLTDTIVNNVVGTAISIGLTGQFIGNNPGEISNGSGGLSFFLQGYNADTVYDELYQKGKTISGLSFSGGYLASVPEPTTVLGLGAIGAAMAVSRRRKAQVSS